MSLRVVRSTDIIQVQHPIFLIVGLPGLGKSSLGYSCENPLLLNFDSESAQARTVNRGDSIDVLSIEDFRDLEQNGHPLIDSASTVILDTVGNQIELMKRVVIKDNPKHGYSGNLTQQGWGALKNRFTDFLLKYRSKKNLFLITHAKQQGGDDRPFYRPQIDGGARDYVVQQADFVGFLHMVGTQRILDFSPNESWFGKNPAQWPAWEIPDPQRARTFMTQLFQRGRERFAEISSGSTAQANQVMDWKSQIETLTRLEELNKAVPQILGLNDTVRPQVAMLILERGKTLGFTYDNVHKRFLSPVPEKEVLVSL